MSKRLDSDTVSLLGLASSRDAFNLPERASPRPPARGRLLFGPVRLLAGQASRWEHPGHDGGAELFTGNTLIVASMGQQQDQPIPWCFGNWSIVYGVIRGASLQRPSNHVPGQHAFGAGTIGLAAHHDEREGPTWSSSPRSLWETCATPLSAWLSGPPSAPVRRRTDLGHHPADRRRSWRASSTASPTCTSSQKRIAIRSVQRLMKLLGYHRPKPGRLPEPDGRRVLSHLLRVTIGNVIGGAKLRSGSSTGLFSSASSRSPTSMIRVAASCGPPHSALFRMTFCPIDRTSPTAGYEHGLQRYMSADPASGKAWT